MSNLKYQRLIGAMLCATALVSTDLATASNALSAEELEGPKYNLRGVALFSGKDPFSYEIKALTRSKISHVGIILSDVRDENQWYCFESTGSASEVIIEGEYPHVRITDWNTVQSSYAGKVGYRLLVFKGKNRPHSNEVTRFVEEYDGKSYTKNPFRLLKAVFGINRRSKSESLKTVFCSELTAKMLMDLKILRKGIAGNYLPKAFSSKQQSSLRLRSGIWLTPTFTEE